MKTTITMLATFAVMAASVLAMTGSASAFAAGGKCLAHPSECPQSNNQVKPPKKPPHKHSH